MEKNGDLVLTSTRFESLGVGLPFSPGEGQFENIDGQFHITGLNRRFPQLTIRTMPVAEQALIVKGRTYRFDDYFAPGAMLKLKVRKLPLFRVLICRPSKGEG